MKRLLRGEECVADYFHDTYSVRTQGGRGHAGPVSVYVATACGGCHACRRERRERDILPPGCPTPVWDLVARAPPFVEAGPTRQAHTDRVYIAFGPR